MHIVDRRLNPGSKSLENRQRFLRRAKALVQGSRNRRRAATSRMSWKAARSASRSTGRANRAFAAKAAPATWCFPATRSSSKVTCCRVREEKAAEDRPSRVKATVKMRSGSFCSRDEFVDLFLDDLELPDLAKRKLAEAESEGTTAAGDDRAT